MKIGDLNVTSGPVGLHRDIRLRRGIWLGGETSALSGFGCANNDRKQRKSSTAKPTTLSRAAGHRVEDPAIFRQNTACAGDEVHRVVAAAPTAPDTEEFTSLTYTAATARQAAPQRDVWHGGEAVVLADHAGSFVFASVFDIPPANEPVACRRLRVSPRCRARSRAVAMAAVMAVGPFAVCGNRRPGGLSGLRVPPQTACRGTRLRTWSVGPFAAASITMMKHPPVNFW